MEIKCMASIHRTTQVKGVLLPIKLSEFRAVNFLQYKSI